MAENVLPKLRSEQFSEIFPDEPRYRLEQIEKASFAGTVRDWLSVTVLSLSLREELSSVIPWMTLSQKMLVCNKLKDTVKAVLETTDGYLIEAVLMKNTRSHWTICVSSQIGCAMNCSFCATGKMGFTRNLSSDEIVDQYRFWQEYISAEKLPGQITNIVFMGMGEPLANYNAVRASLNTLLKYTAVGPTHITVSSVGLVTQLEKILDDPLWPPVRLAISLHSADVVLRKTIVPMSFDSFHSDLIAWSKRYLEKQGNRRHHITFEYILLDGVNDAEDDARKLAHFVQSIDSSSVRVNLIPYNETRRHDYRSSTDDNAEIFLRVLIKNHIRATIRRSKGLDIAAACGQLAGEKNNS